MMPGSWRMLLLCVLIACALQQDTNALFKGTAALKRITSPSNYLQTVFNSPDEKRMVALSPTPSFKPLRRRQLLNPLQFKLSENEESKSTFLDLDDDDDDDDDRDSGNSGFLLRVSKGIIPLAASVGFAATPSSRIAARIAGAAAGGVVGIFANAAIRSSIPEPVKDSGDRFGGGGGSGGGGVALESSVAAALKEMRRNSALDMELEEIERLAKKHRVPAAKLGLLFTYMFADVVYDAVIEENMDLTVLSDVSDFAVAVGLSPAEIGDGFALAANKIASGLELDSRGFYNAEFPTTSLYAAAKTFFLADKMIGSLEGYYGGRLGVALSFFTPESYKDIITDACKNLFRRCVESVLSNPAKFTSDEVDELKDFLTTSTAVSGMRPANMQNLIMEAIQFSLDQTMPAGSDALTASVDNYDDLVKAQEILGWSSRELGATLETRTMPKFEAAVRQLFKDIEDKPSRAEELEQTLPNLLDSLKIDPRKARVLVTTCISEMNAEYMSRIDKVYNVSGAVEPAFKIMMSYAHTHQALSKITAGLMDGIKLPVPGLPFAEMVRVSMYELQVSKGAKTTGVDDEMFSLSPAQQKVVRKHLALPKVTTWITQCVNEGNFEENAKSAYRKLLEEYSVGEGEWIATAVDFYYQEVSKISNSRQVPTAADMNRLSSLKSFLDVTDELVETVHLELLGDKYVKAVTESMTPTGVITEEYIDGLNRLRERLGFSEQAAERLLGFTARSRIGPIVKDLADIWKSDTDANFRREKERKDKEAMGKVRDKSRDFIDSTDNVFGFMELGGQKEGGGPNVFMREALNLIDFIVANYAVHGKTMDQPEDVPVTAVGLLPEQELAGMFKHYLITRLAEQDPELRQRYLDTEPLFAKVLGITVEGQSRIRESLSYTAYKRLLRNSLLYKPTVEQQDLQQFVVLKENLQLESDVADKVYKEATRDAVLEHATVLFRAADDTGEIPINADRVTVFREQIQSLGLDIQKDTGFNEMLVSFMYALEVQQLVDSGNVDAIEELTEAYDIPEDRAAEIVEACSRRYVSQLLHLALRSAKKYDEKDTMKWVKEIVKFAPFISGQVDADGNLFSEADKKRIIAFYQAEIDSQEDQELLNLTKEYGNMVEKMREMILLTEDFVPPLQGIEGLLGKGQSLKQLEIEKAKEQSGGKRPWAWG